MSNDEMEESNNTPSEHSASKYDVITYMGYVNQVGYELLCENLRTFRTPGAKRAYLVPITFGGNPDAGYRIARALGHVYPEDLIALIPSVCKSAGTLMCLGMRELVICDQGELGPLDTQLEKKDELFELSSGLDISQAINALQFMSQEIFRDMLVDLKLNGGLGTKLAAELASSITTGLMAPIASQIDPIKLGEHQRAMSIATAYGKRLNKKFNNTSDAKISRLITDYPSHSFVIDRKEAKELFSNVRSPTDREETIAVGALDLAFNSGFHPNSSKPAVTVTPVDTAIDYLANLGSEDKKQEQEQEYEHEQPISQSNAGSAESYTEPTERCNGEEVSAAGGTVETVETTKTHTE